MPGLYKTHPAIARWERGQYGPHGRLNAFWREHLRRDPDLKQAVICIELVFGLDKVVRISSRACSTTSGITGEALQWEGRLGDAFEIQWEMEPGDPASRAKQVSVKLPNSMVDAAALIRKGRTLAGVAEVSLQVPGFDYDNRFIFIRGDLTDVQYGALQQEVNCVIVDPRDSIDTLLPPYIITADRFSGVLPTAQGKALAVVSPEFGPIPAHFVSSSTSAPEVVVAHGHYSVDAVYIDGVAYASGSSVYPWAAVRALDGAGDPYTGVQFSSGSGSFVGDGSEKVYVELSDGPGGRSPVDGVRAVTRRFTSLGVTGADEYLFGVARARAGHVQGRLCANAAGGNATTAIGFIEGEFLTAFPMVSMVWWNGGYGPVIVDRDNGHIPTRLVADQWPVLDRASLVVEQPSVECYNRFSIHYDYDPMSDEHAGYLERTPQNSAVCAMSEDAVGSNQYDPIETPWITDPSSAAKVLDWFVTHRTMPGHDVQYDVSPGLALVSLLGDNVYLTDDEFGWSSVVATTIYVTFRLARSSLGLRVWNPGIAVAGAAQATSGATGAPPGGP